MRSSQLKKKLFVHIGAFISLTIICLALWVMYDTLQTISLNDVVMHFRALPATSVLLAFVLTAASYFVVTGYDVVALKQINHPLPYPRAALSAFLASTFGNNIGFAILTGTSIRFRIYSQVGLSALEIAGVSTMCALTTILGMSTLFGVAMLFQPSELAQTAIPIPVELRHFAGGVVLILLIGYVVFSAYRPITLRTSNFSLRLPTATTTAAQIGLATLNLSLVATLIYALLSMHTDTGFITFLGVYIIALMAGSASNVPGGIGVFESVLLLGLPEIPPGALLGSILLFRCIYYLTPLGIAALTLAAHEAKHQQERIELIHDRTTDWLDAVGPQIMAIIVVFAGTVLLFSSTIPTMDVRATASQLFVPLPIMELSHLLASGSGVGLIILARGLSRRLDGCYQLTVKLMLIGIAASLLNGFSYRTALVLGLILIVLSYTRPEFHRKGSAYDQGFPAEWVSLLTAILASTVWLGLFAYKHVDYTSSLWWYFGYDANFSHFLRSMLVVFTVTGSVTIVNLLRPDPEPEVLPYDWLDNVRSIVANETNTRANLALLGDKRFLFSESGHGFIMYQVRGKSWIALCDPTGPQEEKEALLWRFRELCDRYGASPIFYLVDKDNEPLYKDLGMTLIHLGDDARVPLTGFSLGDPQRTHLRNTRNKMSKQGLSVEFVESDQVPLLLPDLKSVSDDWLTHQNTGEMSFSRGYFQPEYLVHFPCALVYRDQRLIAFAALWTSAHKEELSVDLLRFTSDVPEGIMAFLFVEIMLWGKAQRYQWFNLGMAPLQNLRGHPLEPLWHRAGSQLYRQIEHFLNLESLRQFEEGFKPVWRPKHLAAPDVVSAPRVFWDIAKLITRDKT